MTNFSIATWNVNSIRVRLAQVLEWLTQNKPDVLALQEIKSLTADFPSQSFEELGYSAIVSGQKAYNGVAILTRHPHDQVVTDIIDYPDPQRRILALTINHLRIVNVYIPNGESINSTKYQYKLSWLANFTKFLSHELSSHEKMIILGDFNIAPQAIDVYDPLKWQDQVLFSPPEREAFDNLLQLGFKDCYRLHYPNHPAYSWWDYRMNMFKRNLGCRIDHVLSSDALASACNHCTIDPLPRSLERPSDHAPVIAEFNL